MTSRGRKFYVELPSAKADNEGLKYYVDKEVILGIRPENIHDEEMFLSTAKTGMIEATVDVTEMLGAETFLYLTCEGIRSPLEYLRDALHVLRILLSSLSTRTRFTCSTLLMSTPCSTNC